WAWQLPRRSEALSNRKAAAHAEGARRNLQPGRCLAALVFAERHFVDDLVYDGGREAALDDLVFAQILDDVSLEDRVEHFVRGQRVLVFLVRAEFSARRFADRGFGDERRGTGARNRWARLPAPCSRPGPGVHPARDPT